MRASSSFDAAGASRSLLAQLSASGTPERAEHEKAYLKSDLRFLGVSVPEIRRAGKGFRRARPELSRDEFLVLVEELWRARVHELRVLAVELLKLYADLLTADDAVVVERLIRNSGTWALVDGLAASVAGALVDAHPEAMDAVVRRWAGDGDLWVRRASLLAHLPGLRRGEGDLERLCSLADAMLDEREFFIRKAIGWVLREAGKRRPEEVAAWLEPRIHRASGVTVREAVKYLPQAGRDRLLSRAGRRVDRRPGRPATGRADG